LFKWYCIGLIWFLVKLKTKKPVTKNQKLSIMRKKFSFLMGLISLAVISFAQQTVTIKVLDEKGNPVAGASVLSLKTKSGAPTDASGANKIKATPGDQLEISYNGYETQTIRVGQSAEITIILKRSVEELGQIVMVGTRSTGRLKTETPVPVDVIKINQAGMPTARMDLTSILNMAAPSFNYNKQSGADGADHIDLGTLRGLGPDQTLVLINGKRRHQTAFVGLFGSRGRGNSGADLNAFPQIAVDRIEILRDGASAQYGSDAMAGVMNIVLKKDINHWTVNTGWSGYKDTKFNARSTKSTGQYYYGPSIDGNTYNIGLNGGFGLGTSGGFINLSFDYLTQGKTYRQVKNNSLTSSDGLPENSGRRAFGDGSVNTMGGMYNMEIPITSDKNVVFYSFGGYNQKKSDAFAYTRNWNARPDRFPVSSTGKLLFDADIMKTSVKGDTFYNPHIQTTITDYSVAAGIKGKLPNGWNWDLSNTNGKNDFHYYGDKTYNASIIGKISPTHFDDGSFNFAQNTINLDFSKSIVTSNNNNLNLGIGAEYRQEQYAIKKGEEASYIAYANPFDQAPGSQGFPGFSPADEVKSKRHNTAFYIDAELNASKKLLVDFASRFESYSDFGSILTYKFATRYKASKKLTLRGSVSSGFRAPSLQQMNFSNTITSFNGGQLVQSRIARNNDAITKAAGIPGLKEETSTSGSMGFSWKVCKGINLSVDGYGVGVKNRIVLSGLFNASDATLPVAFTNQLNAIGVSTAQFFDNAVNTSNYGLDVVMDYTKKSAHSTFKMLLTGNIQKMKVNSVHIPDKLNDSYLHRKTFFSDREEAFLLASAPRAKFALSCDWLKNKTGFGMHFTYFGNIKTLGFGWTGFANKTGTDGPGDPLISGSFSGIDPYVDIDGFSDGVNIVREEFNYRGKITTDIYGSYKICKRLTLFAGVDNLFSVHPDFAAVKNAKLEAFDNETGGPWESVQMGFNGSRLFVKLAFDF
jgi:iron complex outermembrane receptor protein